MIREDLLIDRSQRLLGEFLTPMQDHLDKPRKRFLDQVIRGILFSGTLVVMELCRWVKDGCCDRFYRDKRLLSHLTSLQGNLHQAVAAYRQQMARHIQPDTPVIIDLTDLAKPGELKASGMLCRKAAGISVLRRRSPFLARDVLVWQYEHDKQITQESGGRRLPYRTRRPAGTQ